MAGLMGLGIAEIGIGYFSYLTHPPPPDLVAAFELGRRAAFGPSR